MTGTWVHVVAAAEEQLPEDVGKAGPLGLLLIVLLLIAVALLVRSMTTHLKRIPPSFDAADQEPAVEVPDTPEGLLRPARRPGEDVLDALRRRPRAIEGPRSDDDGRPAGPGSQG